jgi:hypothetical protein
VFQGLRASGEQFCSWRKDNAIYLQIKGDNAQTAFCFDVICANSGINFTCHKNAKPLRVLTPLTNETKAFPSQGMVIILSHAIRESHMNDPMSHLLPPAFADLAIFVADWGASTTDARNDHRHRSTMAEIRAFYDAFTPRLEAALAHLDPHNTRALPEPEKRLLHLCFGYIEAALAVEVFNVPGVPGIPYPKGFFGITRELI